MPPFPKPAFEYVVDVKKEIKHIKKYRDTKLGRAIPKSSTTNILIATWNIANFGVQKREAEHYKIIAEMVTWFDVIAIQEVVAGPGGAQAVAILNDALNTKGEKWDYSISNPTFSSSYKAERYAFVWKTAYIKKKGDAWLENKYKVEIDRVKVFYK